MNMFNQGAVLYVIFSCVICFSHNGTVEGLHIIQEVAKRSKEFSIDGLPELENDSGKRSLDRLEQQAGHDPLDRLHRQADDDPNMGLWQFAENGASSRAEAFASSLYNNVSAKCRSHMQLFLQSLADGDIWALRMLDSMGKPPSGLLDYNLKWPGSWEECLSVKAEVYAKPDKKQGLSNPFLGRYCTAVMQYTLPQGFPVTLAIGTCFPDSCSSRDASQLTDVIVDILPANMTTYLSSSAVYCQEKHLQPTTRAILAISVVGVFAALMVMGTLMDIFFRLSCTCSAKSVEFMPVYYRKYSLRLNNDVKQKAKNEANNAAKATDRDLQPGPKQPIKQQGLISKILLAFSVISNGEKILSMDQPAGSLTCVNGIRFLSMTWVIMGHNYSILLSYMDNSMPYAVEMLDRMSVQLIINATFSVDTFFLISGMLVSYLSLKELKRLGSARKFNWGVYYVHRFIRLTPPYMMVLMINSTLSRYWGSGPLWNQRGFEKYSNNCRDNWWQNLLYINNLFPFNGMCFPWSWYLANDMQFYIVSPLFLLALFYYAGLGSLTCLMTIVATMVTTGVISNNNQFPANMMAASSQAMETMYIVPWCRIGPYIVGIYTGFMLYKTNCKVNIRKVHNAIGWVIATAVALLIVFGTYTQNHEANNFNAFTSAMYNGTSRTVWAMCVAWLIFACVTGNGGPVNRVLSWCAWAPLGRLSYCAYLVHPIVMYTYCDSFRTLAHGYDIGMAYIYIGNLVMSYGVAFVASLAFESPIMNLEKIFLRRGKTS